MDFSNGESGEARYTSVKNIRVNHLEMEENANFSTALAGMYICLWFTIHSLFVIA